MTRRTLDTQMKTKQVEMINEKICRILRVPTDFLNIDDFIDDIEEKPKTN
jgi:hypothetical protein